MAKRDVLKWSCDEKDRRECRNAHGCHCREITDLLRQVADKQVQIGAGRRMIGKLEKRFGLPVRS